ncbi:hypothetical protein L873DRAFT_1501880 [Choiromyces venosus 120613-1]|uniref:Uncharacterized protein n=1 Tax=Choiromyces venosus 120613-1 TaxID=1336337 RepID=A0A3N4J698_9PEZI|nr:hypothetical protein L873DRAFT_1501880 [Choiromyces venosus 120613-1]
MALTPKTTTHTLELLSGVSRQPWCGYTNSEALAAQAGHTSLWCGSTTSEVLAYPQASAILGIGGGCLFWLRKEGRSGGVIWGVVKNRVSLGYKPRPVYAPVHPLSVVEHPRRRIEPVDTLGGVVGCRGGLLLWRRFSETAGGLLMMHLWQVARRWIFFRGPLAGGSISCRLS